MFWTIVLLLAWYNTGLLCCFYVCYLEIQEGRDQTTDDLRACLALSLLGWLTVLLILHKVTSDWGKNSNNHAKVILKGKGIMCAPPPLYRPRNEYERKVFPNLGYAKIIKSPYKNYVGQCGVIVHRDPGAVRIVFSHFWDRPDGMSPEKAQNSTWCFPGEYEEYTI